MLQGAIQKIKVARFMDHGVLAVLALAFSRASNDLSADYPVHIAVDE